MVTGPYAFELKKAPINAWLFDGENKLFETDKATLENKQIRLGRAQHTLTTARVKNSIFIATDKRFFGLKRDGIFGDNYLPSSLYTGSGKNISTANADFFVYDPKFNEKLDDDVKQYIIPKISDTLDEFNNKGFFGKRKQLKNDKYDKITSDQWHPLMWNIITKAEISKGGMFKNKSGILFDFDWVISPAYIEYRNKMLSENPKYLKFFNEIQDAKKESLSDRINSKAWSILHKELGIQLTLGNDEYVSLLYETISKYIKQ